MKEIVYPYYNIQEFDKGKLKNVFKEKFLSYQSCRNRLLEYRNSEYIPKIYPNSQYLIIKIESQYSYKIIEIINKDKWIKI